MRSKSKNNFKSKPKLKPKPKYHPKPHSRSKQKQKQKPKIKKIKISKETTIREQIDENTLLHQQRVIQHMLTHRGLVVAHGMGSGKTRISILLVLLLKIPAIVVVPASLQENYKKEIDKVKNKIKGVDESLFTVISSTSFLTKIPDCKGKILIVDEAHELRNEQGKISQSVLSCAIGAQKVLLMTGTPLVNKPGDIAPLLNMIVKDHINVKIQQTNNTNEKMTTYLFKEIPTGILFSEMFGESGVNDLGMKLWKQILPCTFSYYVPPKSDDFPDKKVIDVMVPMTQKQEQFYRAWESRTLTPQMVKILSKTTSKSTNTEALQDKMEKMSQFKAYLDGGKRICNVVKINNEWYAPKFEIMVKHLVEHHQNQNQQQKQQYKTVIFSQFLDMGIDIAAHMLLERGIKFVRFTGQETQVQKKLAVDDYNLGRTKVFLISSAGGLGLDLKNTDFMHIMEPAWNLAKIDQVEGRVVRFKSSDKPGAVVTIFKYYCYKPNNNNNNIITNLFRSNTKQITLSADMYLKMISEKKHIVNTNFFKHIVPLSIENSPVGSCTEDQL